MEMVEKTGSGIRSIRDLCRQHGVPEPAIEVSDSWVTVTFPRLTAQDSRGVGTKSALSRDQVGTKFRNQILKLLIDAGWLEMTIPDKPTSSKQKYRLTEKGRNLLAELEKLEE